MKTISVLIADDHKIVRMGLKAMFAQEKDIRVVGEAEDGNAALAGARKLRPDVVVMDLMMPGLDGIEATAELVRKIPDTRIVILTSFSTSDGIVRALEAGAMGAVLKTSDDSSLLTAIRAVADGRRFVSPEISQLIQNDPPAQHLSSRQEEVLHSIIRGLTNRDIAVQLGISEARVEEHVNAILQKINAANRAEAVAIASAAVKDISGDGEVVAGPKIAESLRAQLAAKGNFRVVLDETIGSGFTVRLDGGRVEHDFTGATIAAELAKRLRPDLAKLMSES